MLDKMEKDTSVQIARDQGTVTPSPGNWGVENFSSMSHHQGCHSTIHYYFTVSYLSLLCINLTSVLLNFTRSYPVACWEFSGLAFSYIHNST